MRIRKIHFLATFLMLFCVCMLLEGKVEAAGLQQVTGLKQTVGEKKRIKVEWLDFSDNDIHYQVKITQDKDEENMELWTDKSASQASSNMLSTIYIGALNPGETYYVRVRGYKIDPLTKGKSYGAWSEILECVTAPEKNPQYLKKTNSTTTSLTMQWGAVEGATKYVVRYFKSGTNESKGSSVTTTKTSVKLTGLKKNTIYVVRVYGIRETSDGAFATKESTAYAYANLSGVAVTPTKITGAKVSKYDKTKGQISVTYKRNACADGYDVEVWTAYKKKDTKVAYVDQKAILNSNITTTLKKASFKNHQFYKVRVRAYSLTATGKKKQDGWSTWMYVCQQPDITKIKVAKKGITLTWDKITGADRYVVYASTKRTSGYKKVTTTTKNTCTMKRFNKKALKKGQNYYFYVVAQNKDGKKYISGEAGNATKRWSKKYTY